MALSKLVLKLAALVVCSAAARADSIPFFYSFPLNGVPNEVIGSGILTTTPFVSGEATITGISGTRTVAGVTQNIASLLPPGEFRANDNLLFSNMPYLDFGGFSFTLVSGGGDNGSGKINVFFDSKIKKLYTEASSQVGYGNFTIVPESTPPAGIILLAAGCIAAFRRRCAA